MVLLGRSCIARVIHTVYRYQKKISAVSAYCKIRFAVLAIAGCYFVFRTGEEGGEEVYKTELIKKLNDYDKAVKDSVAEKSALIQRQSLGSQ